MSWIYRIYIGLLQGTKNIRCGGVFVWVAYFSQILHGDDHYWLFTYIGSSRFSSNKIKNKVKIIIIRLEWGMNWFYFLNKSKAACQFTFHILVCQFKSNLCHIAHYWSDTFVIKRVVSHPKTEIHEKYFFQTTGLQRSTKLHSST